MARYKQTRILINASEYYSPLRTERGLKKMIHYATPVLHNPTIKQRAKIITTNHIWKYGDRFYKLADVHYGDVLFWWVIAWYNGYPTEAEVPLGTRLSIPVSLEDGLRVLRGE